MNRSTKDNADVLPEPKATAEVPHVCFNCRHHRVRKAPRLFSQVELQTAGGLKAYNEWKQQDKQHAEREAQLMASGGAFTYEPHHYAWCAAFTHLSLVEKANAGDQASFAEAMQLGCASMHPVTGEIAPIYALCIRKNARGDCSKYEP